MAKPIKIQIVGDASKFSKAVDTAGSKMGSLAKLGGAAFAGLGAGAVAGLGKGIASSVEFDQNMREVFTLLPGISQGAMDDMKDQLLDLGTEFGAMSEDTIPALYDSLSAGVPPDNVFAFLETSQKFATAGATDVSTAVDGLTTVVNAFGLEADEAGAAADVLFAAVKAGKTTVPELSGAMFQVAPIAAAMGVEIETVAAGFASLTAQGVPTSVAATQMKGAFSELAKAGSVADVAFRNVADKGFAEFIEGGGTVQEAFDMLRQSADENGLSVVDMFGSIEAGQAVMGLTGDQAGRFSDNLAAMGDATGSVDAAFEVMDAGIGATWNKIKAGTSQALIQIGDAAAPFVDIVADKVLAAIPVVTEFFEGTMVPALLNVGTFIRDEVIPVIGNFAGVVLETVVPAIKEVAGWISDTLVPAFHETVASLKDDMQPTLVAMQEWWRDGVMPAMESIVEMVREDLVPVLLQIAEVIRDDVAPFVLQKLIPAMAKVSGFVLSKLVPALAEVVGFILKGVVPALEEFVAKIITTWENVIIAKDFIVDNFNLIVDTITGLPGRIDSAATGMWDGIKDAFRSAINWIIDKWNGLSFTLPSASFLGQTIGGGTISTPNIARFAYGTNFAAGGVAMVGEHGPEVVNLPRGASVTPNHRMGGGGGDTIVNVYAQWGGHEVGREASEAIAWTSRTAGV